MEARRFADFASSGRLKPFLESFLSPAVAAEARGALRQSVLAGLWKLELAGLLVVFPFREGLRLDTNLLLVRRVCLQKCAFFQLEQVAGLLSAFGAFLGSREPRFLDQIEALVARPSESFLASLGAKFADPRFDFGARGKRSDRGRLAAKFAGFGLENHSKMVPRNLSRLRKFAERCVREEIGQFWGSLEFDFRAQRLCVEIASHGRNFGLVRQFAQLLRLVFGMGLKGVALETGTARPDLTPASLGELLRAEALACAACQALAFSEETPILQSGSLCACRASGERLFDSHMARAQKLLSRPKLFAELEKPSRETRVVEASSDVLAQFLGLRADLNVSPGLTRLPRHVQEVLIVDSLASIPMGLEHAKGARVPRGVFADLHSKAKALPIR